MEKVGSEKKMEESKVFRSWSDTFVIAGAESQEEGPHTPEWGLRTWGHHCLHVGDVQEAWWRCSFAGAREGLGQEL